MRKELDLEYTERIEVIYACDEEVEEAIQNFSDYICNETLAVGLEGINSSSSAETAEREHAYGKSWKIGDKEVYLAIKPLSSRR
jgi:hypothetical protein